MDALDVSGVVKRLRRLYRRQQSQLLGQVRRSLRLPRRQRRGQDHDAAHGARYPAAGRRRDLGARQGAGARPCLRHRLPARGARALPRHVGDRHHRLFRAAEEHEHGGSPARGPRAARPLRSSARRPGRASTSFPRACRRRSNSPRPWSTSPSCSFSTSPFPASIRSTRACSGEEILAASRAAARPSSSPRMSCSMPSGCATGCCCSGAGSSASKARRTRRGRRCPSSSCSPPAARRRSSPV